MHSVTMPLGIPKCDLKTAPQAYPRILNPGEGWGLRRSVKGRVKRLH